MSTYMKGICCTLLSAVIFGFTPILVRIAYEGGANSITITFLRAWLALPLLYALMHRRHIPLRLEDSQVKHVLLLGIVGSCATTVCLYMSYNFISVGMATTLHFIYPILVSLGCVLFFRQRLQTFQLFSLILGCIGISTFMDLSFGGSFAGIALALISGFFYAFHISYISASGLQDMYFFKLSFYLCLITGTICGLIGALTGTLSFHLTWTAWGFAVIVSFFVSVGAISLLQLGIRMTGPCTASILSTLEPITSVLLGVIILDEKLTFYKGIGCILILSSVIVITLGENRNHHRTVCQSISEE